MIIWIRYFFPFIDPYELTDTDFAERWQEAKYLLIMTKPIKQTADD